MTDVLVVFGVDPADQAELVDLARQTLPIFAKQPGFLGGTLYKTADGKRLVQHLRWRSPEDNLACMASPDWQENAGRRFMAFMQAGKATMDPQVVEVVATTAPN